MTQNPIYDPCPQSLSMNVMMSAPSLPGDAPPLRCELPPSGPTVPLVTAALWLFEGWPGPLSTPPSSGTSTCKMFLRALKVCTSIQGFVAWAVLPTR